MSPPRPTICAAAIRTEGGVALDRLDDATIDQCLLSLTGWSRDGDTLVRSIKRRNWREAITLVDIVADEADRRNHHPDVCVTDYRVVTFRLTTHSAGGITGQDVDLARAIDKLIAEGG
jgi:4a-hydroxytetrahydrobiopterin dehydratase